MTTISYILNKTSTFIINSKEINSCELKTEWERERASGKTLLLFLPLSKSITLCKWSIDLYHLLSFVLITISLSVFVVIVNSRRLVYSKSAKIETHRQRQRGIQSEQQSDRQTDNNWAGLILFAALTINALQRIKECNQLRGAASVACLAANSRSLHCV